LRHVAAPGCVRSNRILTPPEPELTKPSHPFLLAAALVACAGTAHAAGTPDAARLLPTDFVADRWFVTPTAESGQKLRFFTDTGGGFVLHADTAERLDLATSTVGEGDEKATFAAFPAFSGAGWIPGPRADLRDAPVRGKLFVAPRSPQSADFGDGMLGQEWFGGSVWTFDYPARTMTWRPDAKGIAFDPAHTVPLGFPAKEGARTTNFPSIEATIDGETLAFLFDTGATLALRDDALARLDDGGPKVRGTSFIVASVFDRWRGRHPEWRVLEDAEDNRGGAPVIEVPRITIAGHTVGPVWFTKRPDANFHEWMSQWMDRRVDGALGGSAFRYFRVTADYPGARAMFER
jgi:hypothetical protein